MVCGPSFQNEIIPRASSGKKMKFWGFSRMHELSREPISVSYECINSLDEPKKPMSRLNYKIPIFF
jgi:hypothetical protein